MNSVRQFFVRRRKALRKWKDVNAKKKMQAKVSSFPFENSSKS